MTADEAEKREEEAQQQLETEALDLSAVEIKDLQNNKSGQMGQSGAISRYRTNLRKKLQKSECSRLMNILDRYDPEFQIK